MLVFVTSFSTPGSAPATLVLPFTFDSADDFLQCRQGYVVLEQLAPVNHFACYIIAHKHNQSKTWALATGILIELEKAKVREKVIIQQPQEIKIAGKLPDPPQAEVTNEVKFASYPPCLAVPSPLVIAVHGEDSGNTMELVKKMVEAMDEKYKR